MSLLGEGALISVCLNCRDVQKQTPNRDSAEWQGEHRPVNIYQIQYDLPIVSLALISDIFVKFMIPVIADPFIHDWSWSIENLENLDN